MHFIIKMSMLQVKHWGAAASPSQQNAEEEEPPPAGGNMDTRRRVQRSRFPVLLPPLRSSVAGTY